MSNINNVGLSGPSAVYASPLDSSSVNVASLTPDALLAYCSTQLQGIDSQVQGYMDQQKTQMNEKEAVQSASQALANFNASPQASTDFSTMVNQIQTAIQNLPAGDPVATKLQGQLNDMVSAAQMTSSPIGSAQPFAVGVQDGKTYLAPSAAVLQGYQSTISGYSDDVSSQQSIGMIQIQSLVSQRQTAVQLTTSMMSTIDQSDQAIAQKIGS